MLLNVCPDQSMKDEGLAREVINFVQKLRKEAKVTPSDPVTVYFKVGIAFDSADWSDLTIARVNNKIKLQLMFVASCIKSRC